MNYKKYRRFETIKLADRTWPDHEIEQAIPQVTYENKVIDRTIQSHYRDYVYPYDTQEPLTMAVTQLQKIEDDHYLSLTSPDDTTQIAASDKGTLYDVF